MTRSRHSIKMGADFVRTQSNIINVPTDLGHYFFGVSGVSGGFANPYEILPQFCTTTPMPAACSSQALGGYISGFINEPTSGSTNALAVIQSLPDIMTNSSGVISGQGQNELPLRETDLALFIQDDFHARPNLTSEPGTPL